MGWVISDCVCVSDRAVTEKQLELPTPVLSVHWSWGQQVKGRGHVVIKCTASVGMQLNISGITTNLGPLQRLQNIVVGPLPAIELDISRILIKYKPWMTGPRCTQTLPAHARGPCPCILACAGQAYAVRGPITQLSANRPSYYYNIDA